MNQSSVIGAALLVAYVIFVINKEELPCYFQVLGIATSAQCATPLTTSGCGSSTSGSGTGARSPILPGHSGSGILGTIGSIGGGVLGGVLSGGGGLGPF